MDIWHMLHSLVVKRYNMFCEESMLQYQTIHLPVEEIFCSITMNIWIWEQNVCAVMYVLYVVTMINAKQNNNSISVCLKGCSNKTA